MGVGRKQKNLTLGEELLPYWEQWCRDNGYDEVRVFMAGQLLLQELNHAERASVFQRVESWLGRIKNGHPQIPPEAADRRSAPRSGGDPDEGNLGHSDRAAKQAG